MSSEARSQSHGRHGAAHKHKDFSFKVGDLVLVKWNDGMVYFAKIKRVDHKRKRCVVVFDDKSQDEAHFNQIHSVDETTTDIICIKCKKDDSDSPNEIVLCDSCGIGYHQKCHVPCIPSNVLKIDTPWQCTYCGRGEKCPYLTESLDVLQNLISDESDSSPEDLTDGHMITEEESQKTKSHGKRRSRRVAEGRPSKLDFDLKSPLNVNPSLTDKRRSPLSNADAVRHKLAAVTPGDSKHTTLTPHTNPPSLTLPTLDSEFLYTPESTPETTPEPTSERRRKRKHLHSGGQQGKKHKRSSVDTKTLSVTRVPMTPEVTQGEVPKLNNSEPRPRSLRVSLSIQDDTDGGVVKIKTPVVVTTSASKDSPILPNWDEFSDMVEEEKTQDLFPTVVLKTKEKSPKQRKLSVISQAGKSQTTPKGYKKSSPDVTSPSAFTASPLPASSPPDFNSIDDVFELDSPSEMNISLSRPLIKTTSTGPKPESPPMAIHKSPPSSNTDNNSGSLNKQSCVVVCSSPPSGHIVDICPKPLGTQTTAANSTGNHTLITLARPTPVQSSIKEHTSQPTVKQFVSGAMSSALAQTLTSVSTQAKLTTSPTNTSSDISTNKRPLTDDVIITGVEIKGGQPPPAKRRHSETKVDGNSVVNSIQRSELVNAPKSQPHIRSPIMQETSPSGSSPLTHSPLDLMPTTGTRSNCTQPLTFVRAPLIQSPTIVKSPLVQRAPLTQPPPVIRTPLTQPPPVIRTPLTQPPPVTRTPLTQPPPVIRTPLTQPPPVTRTPLTQPPPVTRTPLTQPPPVIRTPLTQPPTVTRAPVTQPPTVARAPVTQPPTVTRTSLTQPSNVTKAPLPAITRTPVMLPPAVTKAPLTQSPTVARVPLTRSPSATSALLTKSVGSLVQSPISAVPVVLNDGAPPSTNKQIFYCVQSGGKPVYIPASVIHQARSRRDRGQPLSKEAAPVFTPPVQTKITTSSSPQLYYANELPAPVNTTKPYAIVSAIPSTAGIHLQARPPTHGQQVSISADGPTVGSIIIGGSPLATKQVVNSVHQRKGVVQTPPPTYPNDLNQPPEELTTNLQVINNKISAAFVNCSEEMLISAFEDAWKKFQANGKKYATIPKPLSLKGGPPNAEVVSVPGGVPSRLSLVRPVGQKHQQPIAPKPKPGRVCSLCSREATYLCSGCRLEWYCGRDCQLKAWDKHSETCKT